MRSGGAARPIWMRRFWVGRVVVDRVLSYIVDLRRISPLIFHTVRTLSGSLCSPPSPWGKAYDTGSAFLSFVFIPSRVLLHLAIPQSRFPVCKEDFSLRSK